MAGRGRVTSWTHEQITSMGLLGKDISQAITTPPPVFPALLSKPVSLEGGASRDYKILWKEDFISFLKDSSYYAHPVCLSESKITRYSDKYVPVLSKKKEESSNKDFIWDQLPTELRPTWKRKMAIFSPIPSKRINTEIAINMAETLKVLEDKEKGTLDKDTTDAVLRESEEDEQVEDEQDEEMDEDNDYGNSYFDNGDAYNDEDDNLDDGPIY